MTKQQLLMAVGAVVLVASVAWFIKAPRAEAPVVTQNTTPVQTETATATTTQDTASSTAPTSTPSETPVVKSAPKSPSPTPKPSYTLVTYDGQNFVPHKITIAKGSTVRFLNISTDDMWVASGIHPLHNEYPERALNSCAPTTFDQCTAVAKGGYWDFKFNVDGTWDYHNDKKVISGGIVHVLLPGEH